ncbi:unnamed protein product [Amoebophrya sp. A25]|nr:unnamed protein product [Amoebophrya sp. A25]|eukprot:GSA25T00015291001.1
MLSNASLLTERSISEKVVVDSKSLTDFPVVDEDGLFDDEVEEPPEGRKTRGSVVQTLLGYVISGGKPPKAHGRCVPMQAIQSEHPLMDRNLTTGSRTGRGTTSVSLGAVPLGESESPTVYFGYMYGFTWWCFAIVLGVSIGAVNIVFHGAYHWMEDSFIYVNEHFFSADEDRSLGDTIGYHLFRAFGVVISSVFCGLIVTYLVPECSGGGTISVRACIALGSFVPLHVGIARFCLSAVYLGLGNPLGAEAPTLHICAAVSCSLYYFCQTRPAVADYFPPENRTTMVIVGCTCGLAAAFAAPIGSVLYAMEEFRHSLGDSNMYTTLITTASLIAVVTSQMVNEGKFYETCAHLPRSYDKWEVLWWLLCAGPLGLLCGFLPVLFSDAVLNLRAKLRRWNIVRQMLISAFTTTALGTVCFETTREILSQNDFCPRSNECQQTRARSLEERTTDHDRTNSPSANSASPSSSSRMIEASSVAATSGTRRDISASSPELGVVPGGSSASGGGSSSSSNGKSSSSTSASGTSSDSAVPWEPPDGMTSRVSRDDDISGWSYLRLVRDLAEEARPKWHEYGGDESALIGSSRRKSASVLAEENKETPASPSSPPLESKNLLESGNPPQADTVFREKNCGEEEKNDAEITHGRTNMGRRRLALSGEPTCGWDGVWGAGGRTMKELLKPRPRLLADSSLLFPLLACSIIFFACKFLACLTAVACGGSGGVFAPALVLGAALGSFYGGWMGYFFNDSYYQILFVPMGMAGVFAAMIRLPLTSVVIVFEMTSVAGGQDSSRLVFPMLLCSMIAYFVNVEVQPSTMWDRLMEQDNIDPKSLQQFLNAALENPCLSRRTVRMSLPNGNDPGMSMGVPRMSQSQRLTGFDLQRFSVHHGAGGPNFLNHVRRDDSQISSATSVLPRAHSSGTEADGGHHQEMIRKALERIVPQQSRSTILVRPSPTGDMLNQAMGPIATGASHRSGHSQVSSREQSQRFSVMAFGSASRMRASPQLDVILQNAGLLRNNPNKEFAEGDNPVTSAQTGEQDTVSNTNSRDSRTGDCGRLETP